MMGTSQVWKRDLAGGANTIPPLFLPPCQAGTLLTEGGTTVLDASSYDLAGKGNIK